MENYLLNDRWVVINNSLSSAQINHQIKQLLELGQTPVIILNDAVQQLPLSFADQLASRLSNIFAGIAKNQLSQLVLAYYPQWLVGRLDQPQTWQLALNKRLIREVVVDLYGQVVGRTIQITYLGLPSNSIIEQVTNDIKADCQVIRK